jgi:hypothetical protein
MEETMFFLDILGEQVSQAEVAEMIRMLDIQGTGKVYLEQFKRMALGKSLSPIGIAYPPSMKILNKHNLNQMTSNDITNKIKGNSDQVAFIKPKAVTKEDEDGRKLMKEKMGKEMGSAKKYDIHHKEKVVREIMAVSKLKLATAIEKMKKKKLKDIVECSPKYFCEILAQTPNEDEDKLKRIWDNLVQSGVPYIDIRSVSGLLQRTPYQLRGSKWVDQ